jgi:CubicO group peptidase (beta-lactamase class C family)
MPDQNLLARLQAENARLVALLESHRIEWRQPPASLPAALEPSRLSTGEKVALFRRLFRGRTDVYPTRWESKTTDAVDLAGSALQGIVHEPLYEYIDKAILKPLGMKHTSYRLGGREGAPYAVGYASVRQKDGRYDYVPAKIFWGHAQPGGRVFDYQQTAPNYASGMAHTTALDFARLMLMLMNGGAVDGKRILQQSSVDLMMTPIGLRNADGWLQALCLSGPKDIRGRQVWGHDGEDRGAANALYINRETGVGAIVFANAMDPDFTMTYVVVDLDLHLMSWFE